MLTPGCRLIRQTRLVGALRYLSHGSNSPTKNNEAPYRIEKDGGEQADRRLRQLFKILPLETLGTVDVTRRLMTPIDFSQERLKSWWKKRKYCAEIQHQKLRIEKHVKLGNDLAVGHFLLDRGGSVRFSGRPWIKLDMTDESSLPEQKEMGWILEAVDISEMSLYYEGFHNFIALNGLKVFIARDSPHLDDWCLDTLCCNMPNVESIDLSGCKKVSANGIQILHRLKNLKTLIVKDNPALETSEAKLTIILLQDILPELNVEGVAFPIQSV